MILITLLHEDRIYHYTMENFSTASFGSNKKDSVLISDMAHSQVVVKWKKIGTSIYVKAPYVYHVTENPFDKIIVLDQPSRTAILLRETVGFSLQNIKLPYQCAVKIGRKLENNVVLPMRYVSGEHCIVRSETGMIHIEDLDSTNGVYVNGKKVRKARLKSGDVISLMNIRIYLKDSELQVEDFGCEIVINEIQAEQAFNVETNIKTKGSSLKYRRSPRTQEQLPQDAIVLASAPGKGQKFEKSRGMLTSLIGSGAMMASTLSMGVASPALAASRLAMLAMPVSSIASQSSGNKHRKKKLEEYEILRKSRYFNYISEQKARIDAVTERQRTILTRENPSPQECIRITEEMRRNLWERMTSDRDFLDIRLGMGYEELCVDVKARTTEGTVQMEDDEIKELSEQLIEETRIVDNVPSRISLTQNNTIGIIGDRQKVIKQVKNMLVSLTTSHCFQEVRLVGIFDEEERQQWESLKWLPHIWDEEKQFRYLAFDRESTHNICDVFDEVLKGRERELSKSSYGKKVIPTPYYVFVFGSKRYMEKEEIMNRLFKDNCEMGATSLFLFDDLYSLPHDCKFIIDMDNGPCAYPRDQVNRKFFFTPDRDMGYTEFDDFARRMSAIELEGFAVRQEIPNGVTFLQGYGVESVEELDIYERWNQSQTSQSLAAPIGVLGGGKTFALDIHQNYHGPHGLVAGTTGSGKSELLQTWILSMAVTFHPHEVAFVIIDYKGGGMANLLEPLPHVVGKITNIGSNINRSLISLQSEIKRRLVVFDEVGVNHIDKYQTLYRSGQVKEPMPHLIIVADEFAELKKEEPDFMNGLVQAARVGRSLGIHLVLATQKPSGVVDDQIWSNSRFKLCLKVQDVGDSREMIKKLDAAHITQAGRAYIQVGMDEIYELFQSYWSGAPYLGKAHSEENVGNQVRVVDINGQRIKAVMDETTRFKSDVDELTAIVQEIIKTAREHNIPKLSGPWMPELAENIQLIPDVISSQGFDGVEWTGRMSWLKVPVGIYDAPALQAQGVQYMDFATEGHYAIYGAPATGKTSLLKSILLSLGMLYTPDDVSVYILDCGGWSMNVFKDMPHVGGIALDTEEEKFLKFEKLILDEFEERKKLFLHSSVGSLAAYREAVSDQLPAIVIAIDNFVALFDLYPDMEKLFVTIAREGATYGIYLVYTANNTTGIRFKVLQNIQGAMAFELTDRGDYATIVGRLDGMQLPKITGRAFYKGNPPVEFQSTMYMEGRNDMERSGNLKQLLEQMSEAWKGNRPKPIPVMPEQITRQDLMDIYHTRTKIPLGIQYSDISPAYLDLSQKYSMAVISEMGSEKSKILRQIAIAIHSKQPEDKIFVIDGKANTLQELEGISHQYSVVTDEDGVGNILAEIVDMLNQRKRAQNQARAVEEDSFDEQKYISSYEQICIFIEDIKEFVDVVTDESRNSMERICRLAEGLGVLVFVGGLAADVTKYNEIESLTRVIIGNQKGLLLSVSPSTCSFFKNSLKFSEKEIPAGEGNGYLFDEGKCEKIKLAD